MLGVEFSLESCFGHGTILLKTSFTLGSPLRKDMAKRREPSLYLQLRLQLLPPRGEREDKGKRGQGNAARERGQAACSRSSSQPVAHTEWFSPKPVCRRMISGAKYTSIGIFRGFL